MPYPDTGRAPVLLRALFALTTLLLSSASGAAARETRGNLVLDGVPEHSPRVLATLDGWLSGRSASF